jgi:FkbM family methyltransferase
MLGYSLYVPLGEKSRIRADLAHSSSILVAYANPPDFPEYQFWRRALKPGDVFVDVGANIGVYSVLAGEMGCQVISFEPDHSNFQELQHNVDVNEMTGLITCFQELLADSVRPVQFLAEQDSLSRIVSNSNRTHTYKTMMASTLDSRITSNVRGMKIDVEGAEMLVLLGATDMLTKQAVDIIQLEWNTTSTDHFSIDRNEITTFLDSFGYKLRVANDLGDLVVVPPEWHGEVFALNNRSLTELGS